MKNKKFFIVVLAAVISVSAAFAALAAEGWVQNGNEWNYYDKDGNKVYYAWKKGDDGKYRFLDGQGNMAVNTWVDDEYYVDANGIMAADNWLKIVDGQETTWYYFDSNGKYVTSKWKKVGEKWHYFDECGHLQFGWILDNVYYTGTDGAMKTGWQYIDDPEIDEYTQDGPDGSGTKHWYYFMASGKVFKPSGEADFATKKIDEVLYCFDSKGALQTGWVYFGNEVSGVPITGYKYFNENGTLRTGWYSIEPPEQLSGNYDNNVEWFYFSGNGTPKAELSGRYTLSDIVKIGANSYLFNRNGNPEYGFKKIYLSETGSEYETYYFGTSSQQYMLTGKQTIKEFDGTAVEYYFTNKGKGQTGVYSGCLYYKGRIQKPDYGDKYAVISFPNGSGYTNYLVNSSGTILKNKKKLKDSDGNIYVTNGAGIVQSINDSPVSSSSRFQSVTEPEYD